MNELADSYLIPDGTELEDVKDGIRVHGRFDEEPPRTMTRTFFDDFEWSLYLAGASVEELQDGGRRVIVWRDLRGEDSNLEERMETAPGFARDLPPGALCERLVPVLGVRRLLPLVRVHTEAQMMHLLNDDGKTVARLVVEQNSSSDPERERQGALASRLRLLPVRGYECEQAQAALMLKQDLG